MANVIINDTNLTNIANAIREKNGKTTTYRPSDMATAILAIESGGSGGNANIPTSAFNLDSNCSYVFANNAWNWFLEEYKDKINTSNLTHTSYMFGSTDDNIVSNVPNELFELNYSTLMTSGVNVDNMFRKCVLLKKLPQFNNLTPVNMSNMFNGCERLFDISSLNDVNFKLLHNTTTANISGLFSNCYSLKQIPSEVVNELYVYSAAPLENTIFRSGFANCYVLDEIIGLNPNTGTKTITTNMFLGTFANCYRLKEVTFQLKEANGYTNPYQVYWSNQTIDLSTYVGYLSPSNINYITGYNSGLTETTRITSVNYQSLKNNPDGWTTISEYSRYNKTSAINTIRSLPNASRGSGNIIKFKGACGSSTDGGAINTMTEEQIAVATAKGWTVSFV